MHAIAALAAALALVAFPTEVVVIGTVHSATPNFTERNLIDILGRVKPSAILFEVDSSFMEEDSHRLREKYRAMTLEAQAVTMFQDRSKVPVYPYDIEGRNETYRKHNYFDLQKRFSQAVGELYRQNGMAPEAKALFEALMAVSGIRDAIGMDRPEVINSAASDAAIRQKHSYSHAGLARVVELSPSLKEFAEFRKFDREYWEERNRVMAANVLKHAKAFPGGRLVVLCGFEHRCELLRLLRAEEQRATISIREYWSYPAQ